MKPIWIMVMVLGAAAAGGAGGVIATTLAGPAQPKAPRAAEVVASNSPDPFDTRGQLEKSVASLRSDFNQLLQRIDSLNSGSEVAELGNALSAVEKRIADLEKRPAAVASGEGGAAPDANYVRTAVEAAIEEREAKDRAEREAERERMMAEGRERQKTAIVTRLVDALTLTTAQQAKVEVAVANYIEKRTDVWSRSVEARRNNLDFDARAEFRAVDQAAQTAIRTELLGGQLQTFNELVGDNGLAGLTPGGAWGGGGGVRNRGPANREGNRRNNND